MSLFITFEGAEGSGKTFQSRALYRRLTQLAIPVLLTHEPGGTAVGKKIAWMLKWAKGLPISPLTELFLFNASRAQLVNEVIRPALSDGTVVICDRYTDSTVAYQSYGRGLDLATIQAMNQTATQGLVPDLTVLLDISIEEGIARKKERQHDRFEREALDFHRRVREGYLSLAKAEPQRWLVIDARQSKEKITQIIWERVRRMLLPKETS